MGFLDTHDAFVDARRNWSKYNLGVDFDTAWQNYYDSHYDPDNLEGWADPVWSEEAWNDLVRENGGDPDLYKDDYNDLDTFGESVMESFDIMTATDIVSAMYDKYPEVEFVYEDGPKDGEVLLVFDLGDSPLDMEELTEWLEGCGADVSFAGPYMKLLVPEDEMDESLRTKLFKKIGCYSDGSPMEESLLESSNNHIDDSVLADIEDEIYFDLGLDVEVDNDDSYEHSDKAIKITLEDSPEPADELLGEIAKWFRNNVGKTILKGYTWAEAAYDFDSISIGIKPITNESLKESLGTENAKKIYTYANAVDPYDVMAELDGNTVKLDYGGDDYELIQCADDGTIQSTYYSSIGSPGSKTDSESFDSFNSLDDYIEMNGIEREDWDDIINDYYEESLTEGTDKITVKLSKDDLDGISLEELHPNYYDLYIKDKGDHIEITGYETNIWNALHPYDLHWRTTKVNENLTEGALSNGSYSLYNGWVKVPDKDSIPDQYPELEPEYTE